MGYSLGVAEYLTIGFIVAYGVLLASSWGIGDVESKEQRDDTARGFAIGGLSAGVVGMVVTSFLLFLLKYRKQKSFSDWIFQMMTVAVAVTMTSASSYGMGKHKNNTESSEYKASFAFLIIGISLVSFLIGVWQGSFQQINDTAQELVDKAKEQYTLFNQPVATPAPIPALQ